MPLQKRTLYMIASVVLALSRGLGLSLVSTNVQQLQGSLSATVVETSWLIAAYMAPQASLSILLIKARSQFGLRAFGEVSILGFVAVVLLSFLSDDLRSAMAVRFMWGVAAAPISTLAIFYMLEAFPPEKKLTVGLTLGITFLTIGTPVARLISPPLIDNGGWHTITAAELGLVLISLVFVYKLPLTPVPRAKVIHWRDLLSYALLATGLGAITIVAVMGRLYWWLDAPWLGWTLAGAILALTLTAVLELNRETPLIDLRWVFSPSVLHFAAALLIFRMVLSEQASGAPGMFQTLGILNAQMRLLYGVILLATLTGAFICAATLKEGREPALHAVSLALLVCGAWMDSHVTSQTRPTDMLVSQAMIAVATGLFLPPSMAKGMREALPKGPVYLSSFVAVFLCTQITGGMIGSAMFSTFIQMRGAYHTNALSESLPATDPLVTERIGQYGAAYSHVLTSSGAQQAQGLGSLSSVVSREATVLAYGDAFEIIAALAAFALAALLVHMTIIALRARRAAAPGAAVTS
ncbi:MFS transporter [Frigidibacter sp. MR17.24]|uniref:MFS transporter n=1 Tax=Frigidibacter sp. MR17.24 TaxID=3127345 RepID=UPI0030131083